MGFWDKSIMYYYRTARMNWQHPRTNERWMIRDQETIFCWRPVQLGGNQFYQCYWFVFGTVDSLTSQQTVHIKVEFDCTESGTGT
jgi:hypothetical protein